MKAYGLVLGLTLVTLGLPKAALAGDFETCEKESGDVAIAACSRAIASGAYRDHDLSTLYNNRGVEYHNKKDDDQAVADYSQAIAIDSKWAVAYKNRGNVFQLKGDRDRAIVDYDAWIRLEPDRAGALHTRGEMYTGFGWYDLALADLNESLRLRPNDAPTLDGRGRNFLFLKQYDRAIRDFDAAVRIGHFINSLYARGWAKLKIGDKVGGNKDIAEAKRQDAKIEAYGEYYGITK